MKDNQPTHETAMPGITAQDLADLAGQGTMTCYAIDLGDVAGLLAEANTGDQQAINLMNILSHWYRHYERTRNRQSFQCLACNAPLMEKPAAVCIIMPDVPPPGRLAKAAASSLCHTCKDDPLLAERVIAHIAHLGTLYSTTLTTHHHAPGHA